MITEKTTNKLFAVLLLFLVFIIAQTFVLSENNNVKETKQNSNTWIFIWDSASSWWLHSKLKVKEESKLLNCEVTKVSDWDTFYADCWEWKKKYRVLWIDTPEKFYRSKWNEDCFSLEASLKAQELLLNQKVKIEEFWEDTTWVREVAKITLQDWKSFNEEMIKLWYAFAWTDFDNIDKETKEKYDKLQTKAEWNKLWLWSKCEIEVNSKWRQYTLPYKK